MSRGFSQHRERDVASVTRAVIHMNDWQAHVLQRCAMIIESDYNGAMTLLETTGKIFNNQNGRHGQEKG